jgi:flagellar hook protein FlgE
MDVSSIAVQGLKQADAQLDVAAAKIASLGTPSAGGVDVVDVSTEMVALMSAQTQFDANLTTLKTADQIEKSLVDLTA